MIKRLLSVLTVLMVATACGTVATPEPSVSEANTQPAVTQVAAAATKTPVPPTSTPVPPTATPTTVPTEAPTAAPTDVPAAQSSGEYGEGDPQKFAVDNFASAERGKALFNQTLDVDGVEWACATCHNYDSEETKIGPGLLNVRNRALTRVEGQGPYTYIYNSIIHSQDYIVTGYEEGTKMPIYEGVLNNSQVYDLIAYLLTLVP